MGRELGPRSDRDRPFASPLNIGVLPAPVYPAEAPLESGETATLPLEIDPGAQIDLPGMDRHPARPPHQGQNWQDRVDLAGHPAASSWRLLCNDGRPAAGRRRKSLTGTDVTAPGSGDLVLDILSVAADYVHDFDGIEVTLGGGAEWAFTQYTSAGAPTVTCPLISRKTSIDQETILRLPLVHSWLRPGAAAWSS